MRGPLNPEIGVLALPYHEWGTRWMTPHHVLTRLASYFHVVWLEPAHHWRQMRSVGARRRAGRELARAQPPGFERYVPEAWLPDVYRPELLHRLLLRWRVRRGWQRLQARGCRTFVLYLWHPQFRAALDGGRQDLSLYHIDDEYSFSSDAPPVGAEEARMLREVDQAFAISPSQMERKGGISPHLTFVPEGVDVRQYMTRVPEPEDLASIGRPRIGYTGVLKRHLDWPLLRDLARRHPAWSFVFVGPRVLPPETAGILDEMIRYPNVHCLGEKTVTDLAAYPQHFDVCIMPYLVNGYTDNIYPLKLHEYLAGGRPVVGSPIRSLLDFRRVVALASSTEEWSSALGEALQPPAASEAAAVVRQAVAQENDWTELIYRIASTICERLDPELGRRLERVDIPSASKSVGGDPVVATTGAGA
jgi:glycosyltransferase involved in cell wall biosynthesis